MHSGGATIDVGPDPARDCEAIGLELAPTAMALSRGVLASICREARLHFRPDQGLIVHGTHGELLATDLQMRELTGVGWLPGLGSAPPGWVLVGPDGEELAPGSLPRSEVLRTGRPTLGRCLGLRQPGGFVRWVDVSAHPVQRDGVVVATITTVSDRDEWGAGFSAADGTGELDAAVAICDHDGRIVSLDGAAAARYPDAVVGARLAEVVRWNLPRARVERLLEEGSSWSGTLWMPDASGRLGPTVLRIVRTASLTVTIVEPLSGANPARPRRDELTGLPLRSRFLEALGSTIAARDHAAGPVAVVVIELQSLRSVREAYGQEAVEGAVRVAGAALRDAAHGSDQVARVGDASFAVCCPHLGPHAVVTELAERLRSTVAAALDAVRPPLTIACAAGAAVSESADDQAAELLLHAEIAVSQPFDAEIGPTRCYDDALRQQFERRVGVERVVRHAIEVGQVRLGYQPIVDLEDEHVVGAEALLRLLDPDGQPISAAEAIAVAEERGLIGDLGSLILAAACREAARWQAELPERFLTVAVNVSAHQLASPSLADDVARVLAETGLDPGRLKLEMTETVLMQDSDRSAAQLARLKMLGVRLSADDFGTGYSSLAYLKRFPLDAIKADLSFVAGLPGSPEDAAVIAAIVGVADALGLRVVAEGIEHASQRDALVQLGCGFGQGWLWSKAVEDDGFLQRVAELERAAGARTPSDEPAALPEGDVVLSSAEHHAIDTAVGLLAHEVRGPLAVIAGHAAMVDDDPASLAESAVEIQRAVTRIDGLLGRLGDLRALDAGRLQLDPTLVDLDQLAREVVEGLGPLAVPVRVEALHVGAAFTFADAPRLAQVIENLVRNAARFSPAGGSVSIVVSRTGTWAEIAVHDDGPGIAPDRVGLAFRKYGRPDPSSAGSGIGLYLARGIARAHGGDVSYRRRTHRPGSVFTVRLPAAPAETWAGSTVAPRG